VRASDLTLASGRAESYEEALRVGLCYRGNSKPQSQKRLCATWVVGQ